MHTVLATSSLPLFVGALLSDWAYTRSHQIQWLNFASWLTAGGLLLAGLALLWALFDVLRPPRRGSGLLYLLLLAAAFVLGFGNGLIHARDGWATMPTGLVLSVIVVLLLAVASAAGLAGWRRRGA